MGAGMALKVEIAALGVSHARLAMTSGTLGSEGMDFWLNRVPTRHIFRPCLTTQPRRKPKLNMPRVNIESADQILDKEFKLLDHGFVRLLDYMGSDESIVQAARVSYGKGTKKKSQDKGLIRYMLRNRHTSPFEMVEFKFHVKLPIFVARQWIRHRTANVNEYSGRYSVMPDEFYLPDPDQIRLQSTTNNQGRSEQQADDTVKKDILEYLESSQKSAHAKYTEMIDQGLSRELARINLPLAQYTEWYWKIDLHNLLHFLKLRIDPHAQWEIQQYAIVMADMVKAVCPLAYEAFEDYALNSFSFSGPEMKLLKQSLIGVELDDDAMKEAGLTKREIGELRDKLARIEKLK